MSAEVVKGRMAKLAPFEVFQQKLTEAFSANPPQTKSKWGQMIKEARKDTVDELVLAGGKADTIKKAIYTNIKTSPVYTHLHDVVPDDVAELITYIGVARPLVKHENEVYVTDATKRALDKKPKRVRAKFPERGGEPEHTRRINKVIGRVRKEWEYLQAELDRLGADAPQELKDEAARVGLQLFEIETGIDLSGTAAQEKSLIESVLEKAEMGAHALVLSGTPRNYLGGHIGGWESLSRGDQPTDELDSIAKIHDATFILASLEQDPAKRKAKIREADEAMVKSIDDMIYKFNAQAIPADEVGRVEALKGDAEKAKAAIQAKAGLDYAGLTPSDWTTAGLHTMTDAEVSEKAKKVATSFAKYLEKVEAHAAAAQPGAPVIKMRKDATSETFHQIAQFPGYFDVKPPPEEKKDEPEVGAAAADPEVAAEQAAAVKPEEGAGKVQKVSMDLDSILNELKDMNRGTRNPNDIFSLKPITGERNLRPMLVKGDVENILDRKPAEIAENMDFYANWKFVQPGWSNGNQQLLPGQIGVPFRNTLLRAQWDNQDYQFMDNFDVGARDWYEKTYMPHRRRDMTTHSKRMGYKFRIPMIRDVQTHQLPTRNGALPAGVGRPIHFATETANGFDIYTPTQRLSSRQTRLFNGDVVDGRRV